MKYAIVMGLIIISIFVSACTGEILPIDPPTKDTAISDPLPKFESGEALLDAFEEARDRGSGGILQKALGGIARNEGMVMEAAVADSAVPQAAPTAGADFSETNVQVQGVDEADIIKTDGKYIYTLSNGNLVIVRAYPASMAEILSTTELGEFYPQELFIHEDQLLIFGQTNYRFDVPTVESDREDPVEIGAPLPQAEEDVEIKMIAPDYYPRHRSFMTVRLYDISDKEDPELIRNVDFEGNYLTSRKIGDYAYFVVNSYPHWYAEPADCIEIMPKFRDTSADEAPDAEDLIPIARCTDVGYIKPIQAQNFITIASISMTDDDEVVEKEVVVGSGQNVYASLENLYIAQTSWPRYNALGEVARSSTQETVVSRFSLDNGEVKYTAHGSAPGHILNQFSMDEFDGNFRIATTKGQAWGETASENNLYVLDSDLDIIGEVEGIAPGESIYSVRFMGKRAYMVTFKKVDPLFVIDVSDPENPEILGKLKIPGYSDYLHPYDETHLIGVGKEVDESIDADKIHTSDAVYYTAIQGVKLAIFDVSDVENPVEMYKEVIGDRGSDSTVSRDHKAFLFDRERELLVLPVTVAKLKPGQPKSMQGDFTFQGAYVYDLTLEDGFDLRGRVTHYEDDEAFKKSGFYFRGDSAIQRNLYIGNVLYTLSQNGLQLNDLNDLDRLEYLEFEKGDDYREYPVIMY